jgi:hypothetical protein
LQVSFAYKDYHESGRKRMMTPNGEKILRRCSHHILPLGFRKVWHIGFIANAGKAKNLRLARKILHGK